jgi:hypothetical protein
LNSFIKTSMLLAILLSAGCASSRHSTQSPEPAQSAFFARLAGLEGQAFHGETMFMAEPAAPFDGAPLAMHVESVDRGEMRVAFLVDGRPGRTWILRLTADGLQLKHEHREPDGSPSEITNYGGWAAADGTPLRQRFPADDETAGMLPDARTNVWTMEFAPDEALFVYDLRRHDRPRFRAEFDLRRPIALAPSHAAH